MRWSISLGRVGGIPVFLHATFALTLVLAAAQGAAEYGGIDGAVFGVVAAVLLFVCVLLHEVGHSLWAGTRGVQTWSIVLTPVGGVATLDSAPRDPKDELRIALAGPLVNLGLAALLGGALLIALALTAGEPPGVRLALRRPSLVGLLFYLVLANVLLVAFNLLPAFPMDGGRAVRALLAMRLPYLKATLWASRLGQAGAASLALAGLFGPRLPGMGVVPNLALALVGGIIFAGALHEGQLARVQAALRHLTLAQVCRRPAVTLRPGDLLSAETAAALFAAQNVIPVVVGRRQRLVGAVVRGDVPSAPARVATVMRVDYPSLRWRAPLWSAVELLERSGYREVLVTDKGRLHGIAGLSDLQQAHRAPQARRPLVAPRSLATGV